MRLFTILMIFTLLFSAFSFLKMTKIRRLAVILQQTPQTGVQLQRRLGLFTSEKSKVELFKLKQELDLMTEEEAKIRGCIKRQCR